MEAGRSLLLKEWTSCDPRQWRRPAQAEFLSPPIQMWRSRLDPAEPSRDGQRPRVAATAARRRSSRLDSGPLRAPRPQECVCKQVRRKGRACCAAYAVAAAAKRADAD